MAQRHANAEIAEPPQPCPQQGRGFHRLREDAAARADERLLPERFRPGAQRVRREMLDGVFEQRIDRSVARQETGKRLAVREVEAAAAGEQELAAERRHAVVDRHGEPGARQHLGGDQPGRPAADDGGGLG
jgi:hypothetical protein